jgi:hypothetical protein
MPKAAALHPAASLLRVLMLEAWRLRKRFHPMNGENRPLGTDEPVEFEKQPVDIQDLRKEKNYPSFQRNL